MVVVVVVVGATETRATALVGYSVTVFTSSENCLARPGQEKQSIKFVSYQITQSSQRESFYIIRRPS